MAAQRENITTLAGALVSVSLHTLIASIVIVMPSTRTGAATAIGDGNTPLMVFDPSALPPPERLAEPPEVPPEVAAKPPEPPPIADAAKVEPMEAPKPKEIALGVENGNPKSPAWIKSVADGEHTPRESQVEQPALSQTGGTAGPAGVPMPPSASRPDESQPSPVPSATDPTPVVEPSKAPLAPKPDGASEKPRTGAPGDAAALKSESKPDSELPVADKAQEGPKPFELDPQRMAPSDQPAGPKVEKVVGEPGAAPSPLPQGPKQEGATAASPDNASKAQPAVTVGTAPNEPVTPQPERAPAQAQSPRPEQLPTSPQSGSREAEPEASPAVMADTTAPGAPKVVDPANAAAKLAEAATKIQQAVQRALQGQPGVGGQGDNRGDKSDRDSDAATLKRNAKYFRSGRVEAGEGLEIRTVRPNYTLFAQTFANPRSPVMEIQFARDGTVRVVKVVRSSGFSAEIDEPIVAACYNWQATGKALRELPDRPDATVVLTIQFLLN